MLARYCGPGLLGLGITALIAGFMSGMAGNVSAFTTVWTYDIYRPLINSKGSDSHYVSMGRWTTVVGVLISVGTAYLVMHVGQHHGLRAGAVQLLHCSAVRNGCARHVVEAGHRTRADSGDCCAGRSLRSACGLWVKIDPTALRYVALSPDAKALAQDMYQALWSFLICVTVTVVVSLAGKPRPDSELAGLVYGQTEIPSIGDVPSVSEAAVLGGDRGGHVFRAEHHFLVGRRPMTTGRTVSIWFFIGISLLVNGVLILGAGLYEYSHPPAPEAQVVLFQLHASVWWGGLLALIGGAVFLDLCAIARPANCSVVWIEVRQE